jgi:hypothetical protein
MERQMKLSMQKQHMKDELQGQIQVNETTKNMETDANKLTEQTVKGFGDILDRKL